MPKTTARWTHVGLYIACLAMVPALGFGQFLLNPIRPSISVSQTQVPAGSTFEIIASFEMDPDVHLYRDKISFEWEKLEAVVPVETIFPDGKKVRDEFGPDPNALIEIYENSVRVTARMRSTGKQGDPIVILGKLGYQGCTDQVCYPPSTQPLQFDLATVASRPEEEKQPEAAAVAPDQKAQKPPPEKKRGAVWLILMAFVAGIVISLTPCVYPMIPVTAAIIGGTKQRGKLGALLSSMVYVLGLSITYSVLGLVVASGGASVRTWLASPWVVVPVAGIFVVLALSMFEVISIQIQPKSVGRLQSILSGRGHTFAIFVLGLVSGLIAGPCVTAPLAGILVIVAQQASKLLGFFMLFALAWGMGIILIVAGTLTGALPKAGEWTLWVKKLLGFVMLWAAAYFVSPVIGHMAYRAATAAVLLAGAVFLGGFDTLTKESGFGDRMKRVVGLMAVFVAAYLFVGGFLKSDHPALGTLSPEGGYAKVESGDTRPVAVSGQGGYQEVESAVVGPIPTFPKAGYEEVQKAIASGKPVVLDFYADWCRVCKKLADKTLRDPRVAEALKRFQALKVDFDREPRVVERFKVFGVPTVVFIDSDGDEVEDLRFFGFKSAEEFAEILGKVN